MSEGDVLRVPSADDVARANLTRYQAWLGREGATYDELWGWSVTDLDGFWSSIWDYFDVGPRPPGGPALASPGMPGATWFPGATLNHAALALRAPGDRPAVVCRSEHRPPATLTFGELARRTAEVAAGLRRLGVGRGDRVVAYAPNVPETLIAFLATASLGAVWSACSPDFGATAVLDRFSQIEPKVLVAVDGYHYGGSAYDRAATVADIARRLPTLEAVVAVTNLGEGHVDGIPFEELGGEPVDPEPVPFDHPLWVLYSSGTTGLPKAIVHSHGGIALEHLKALSLHHDLGPDDRFFWFTSSGWMMWNLLVGGLLVGASIVLYDGSPAHPDLGALWRLAEETGMTYFGASAPYIQTCMKAGVVPREVADLSQLRGLGSTGGPLSPEGFEWVYANVHDRLVLGSVSGGTDVCTAFVGCCPLLPVRSGELQCRYLGAKVEAFDEAGRPIVDRVGELVVTEPMPSMPVGLWGDDDGRRYRASYFETFPGVWRHGDWVKVTSRGGCVIYGRSDSTLNRGGVRIGTAELYRVVEDLPEVADSLAVDVGRLYLFVVPAKGATLDDDLRATIRERVRTELSPRHVPDEIRAIEEVPRTLNGKKLEVPVKRILLGEPLEAVVSVGAVANPDALRRFSESATIGNEVAGSRPVKESG